MKRILSFLTLALLLLISGVAISKAQSCGNEDECKKLISDYEQKLVGIRDQKNTLSSQIEFADTQIYIATLRIQDTERKISQTADEVENLKGRIVTLNSSLDYLSKLLLEKIVESYKRREPPFLAVFIDPDNASTMINRLKYAKVAEENDRKLAFQVQQAKLNFEQQKDLREDKQKELAQLSSALEGQKLALNGQKAQKQQLLAATQSDERVYQGILSKLRAEAAAIRGIVSGGGNEVEKGTVNAGDQIASIIPSASACSSGAHLHFETAINGAHQNPANYLSSKSVTWDLCGWYGCDSEFGFSGNLPWPINDPVRITQPFGETAFARGSGQYSTHTGIDMYSPDLSVHAVHKGKLYQGSYACGGGYLTYVKVIPDDGGTTSYYLHVYY